VRRRHRPDPALVLAIGLLLVAVPALAQTTKGQHRAMRKYDPAAEITLTGTVLDVKTIMTPSGQETTRIVVGSENGETEVELGPSTFMSEKGLEPAKGDQAVAIGSMTKIEGSDVLLAREITLGRRTLELRDAQGVPVWRRAPRP
jgi:hypothetical protein